MSHGDRKYNLFQRFPSVKIGPLAFYFLPRFSSSRVPNKHLKARHPPRGHHQILQPALKQRIPQRTAQDSLFIEIKRCHMQHIHLLIHSSFIQQVIMLMATYCSLSQTGYYFTCGKMPGKREADFLSDIPPTLVLSLPSHPLSQLDHLFMFSWVWKLSLPNQQHRDLDHVICRSYSVTVEEAPLPIQKNELSQ